MQEDQSAPSSADQVKTAFASADTTAAQRLQNVHSVQQARASQLSRTAAGLKARYGANDAQVKDAEARVTAAKTAAARVAMSHQQFTTPAPKVSTTGWALHGRVFDAQLAPVAGFTVFLVDAGKTYQQSYGFAYTDKTGYFLLNYAGAAAGSQDQSPKDQSPKGAQSGAAPELFIEVADSKRKPVYFSPTAFQPVQGAATYRNIVLAGGDQPVGNPPAEIRKVAMPKAAKKSGK